MAKKQKKAPQQTTAVNHPAASESSAEATSPVRRPQARDKKNGAAPPKKTGAAGVAKPRKKAEPPRANQPTDQEIQLRAYFIAERRHRLHLPGDASSDWIEAKRQLLAGALP